MKVIDDEIRERRRAKFRVVPGIGVASTNNAVTVWISFDGELSAARISLIALTRWSYGPVAILPSAGTALHIPRPEAMAVPHELCARTRHPTGDGCSLRRAPCKRDR